MKFKKKIIFSIGHYLKYILISLGIIFLFCFVFAFTSGPFWIYYHLGTKNISFEVPVNYIVFLGGGGMPSESNLMRTYYTSELGLKYPEASIILAIPGDTTQKNSTVNQVMYELILRGIDKKRLKFEIEGVNTRSQALNITKLVGADNKSLQLVIVTSPAHMRRSIMCFKKVGLVKTGGYPAFEYSLESALSYKNKNLGGNKFIPDVDESISLRYRFWTHLQYEIITAREYTALWYYKFKGWI